MELYTLSEFQKTQQPNKPPGKGETAKATGGAGEGGLCLHKFR